MQDGSTILISYFLPQVFGGTAKARMPDMAPIAPLLYTVFNSILEVFLLCISGYILAGRGILDKKTQKQLNHLNVTLFTPALLFSKVAFFLSPEKFRELWIVPIFFFIVTGLSMAVAYTLGSIFQLKKSQRSFAMAAAMFMNSNSLPIALMQSIVVSVPGLKWGPDDNKNAMLGRALTYLVLYSTLGMILRWSYGVNLLSQADEPEFVPEVMVDGDNDETPLLSHYDRDPSSSSIATNGVDSTPTPSYLHPPTMRRTTYYRSFPNSPSQEEARLPESPAPESQFGTPAMSETEEEGDEEETRTQAPRQGLLPHHLPAPAHADTTSVSTTGHPPRFVRRLRRAWAKFNDFMTIPLWASLLSILVACIPPVQHALEYHMAPVNGALKSAGNCSIPLTLVVLGAYFHPFRPSATEGDDCTADGEGADNRRRVNGKKRKESRLSTATSTETLVQSLKDFLHLRTFSKSGDGEARTRRKKKTVPGETKTVVIAVLSRMVITPMLLMPLVAFAAKVDVHKVFEDPVFVVSNVLLLSSPPALTLAQITQAASGDAFERLISRTIFWSYCVVTPPATIFYVVLGLVFAKL